MKEKRSLESYFPRV